jgi:hypothetical protein
MSASTSSGHWREKTGAQLRLRRGPFRNFEQADSDAECNAELLISALAARRRAEEAHGLRRFRLST